MILLFAFYFFYIQVNLDMTDSTGTGKLVRHMQNLSYAYDTYLKCMGLGPSILSVIDKSPSYPSSPVCILEGIESLSFFASLSALKKMI